MIYDKTLNIISICHFFSSQQKFWVINCRVWTVTNINHIWFQINTTVSWNKFSCLFHRHKWVGWLVQTENTKSNQPEAHTNVRFFKKSSEWNITTRSFLVSTFINTMFSTVLRPNYTRFFVALLFCEPREQHKKSKTNLHYPFEYRIAQRLKLQLHEPSSKERILIVKNILIIQIR